MTSVVLRDPNGPYRDILSYFLTKNGSFEVESDQPAPLSPLSPPKIVIVEPYNQLELTGGFTFHKEPERAISALHDSIVQEHGPTSALVVLTSVLPEGVEAGTKRMSIAGVPVFEKGVPLVDLESELKDICQMRVGFFRYVAHDVSKAAQVLSDWMFLAKGSLDLGDRDAALSRLSQLLPMISEYRQKLEDSNPHRKDAEFILFPMLESVTVEPLTPELSKIPHARRIPAEYLDRQARATFVLNTIARRLDDFANPLLETDPANLSDEALNGLVTNLSRMAHEMATDIKLLKRAWQEHLR